MKTFLLGNKPIGDKHPVFIIGEIGSNYDGDFDKAIHLIDIAREAGVDAVKFQLFKAEDLYPSNCGPVPGYGAENDFYASLKKAELPPDWIGPLKKYTEDKRLVFLCSVFSEGGASFLSGLKIAGFKVASPELNHLPLLRWLKRLGGPVILSTGLSTMDDICEAFEVFAGSKDGLAFMQCVTAYPAKPEEGNLKVLSTLKKKFDVPIGFSDHTVEYEKMPALAVAAGANLLEKHYTYDSSAKGLDHAFALNPGELETMVRAARQMEAIRPDKRGQWLIDRFGSDFVNAVMGDGIKKIADAERPLYPCDKRSLHAAKAIKAGEVFNPANVKILRTERNLPVGMHPRDYEKLMGRRATKDIPYGHGIQEEFR